MTLDIRPETEALLTAVAEQRGIDIETFIERAAQEAVKGCLPSSRREKAPKLTAKNLAVISLMEEWLAKTSTDPKDVRQAEAEVAESMQNLNRNRMETGIMGTSVSLIHSSNCFYPCPSLY